MIKTCAKIILCIVVMTVFIGANSATLKKTDEIGNTIGNILNSGTVVQYKNQIYYFKSFPNTKESGIYRINSDGTNRIKIDTTYGAAYLNIVNDIIYYMESNNRIYRVGINGKGKRLLYSSAMCSFLYVTKEKVYFCDNSQDLIYLKLYSMDLNGKGKKLICSEVIGNLFLYNKRIYYNKMLGNGDKGLFSIDLNGKDKRDLNIRCDSCDINDNKLYYSDIEYGLYVSNLDGTKKRKIINDHVCNFNVHNGYIYACIDKKIGEDIIPTLYKIKIDGTKKTEVVQDIQYEQILTACDWIFFYNGVTADNESDYYSKNNFYRVDNSGKKPVEVE